MSGFDWGRLLKPDQARMPFFADVALAAKLGSTPAAPREDGQLPAAPAEDLYPKVRHHLYVSLGVQDLGFLFSRVHEEQTLNPEPYTSELAELKQMERLQNLRCPSLAQPHDLGGFDFPEHWIANAQNDIESPQVSEVARCLYISSQCSIHCDLLRAQPGVHAARQS